MTPEEARRTISVVAWVRDTRKEASSVQSQSGTIQLKDCTYQNGIIKYYDQLAGRLVYADGLANSRCYVDFGPYTSKLAMSFSGSSGVGEDLLNGNKYNFVVHGSSKTVLTDLSDGSEFVYEVR